MVTITYISPIGQRREDTIPPLTLDPASGEFYNSGDEISMSAEQRDYLSNFYIFHDRNGDVVQPDPEKLDGASAPASTVPLDKRPAADGDDRQQSGSGSSRN